MGGRSDRGQSFWEGGPSALNSAFIPPIPALDPIPIPYSVTNFNEPGLFIYRISGSHPLDPRHGQRGAGGSITGEEDYEYHQEQQYEDQICKEGK